jgi:hypothetical protein
MAAKLLILNKYQVIVKFQIGKLVALPMGVTSGRAVTPYYTWMHTV